MPQQLTGPQQTSSTRRAGRIDALTGVRIVAAAAVFLSHAGAPEFAPASLKTFMAAGYNGVTLFFVLSGFVLAWNYGDRMSRLTPGNVWSFAVARVARIYPVYLLALLWVAAPIVVTSGVPEDLWVHAAALQAWDSDIQVAYGYNGPAWSISVEFFLYACFPLLILALGPIRRNSRGLLIVAGIALAVVVGLAWWFAAVRVEPAWGAPGGSHRWLYRMPLTRLGDFTIGACLALLVLCVTPRRWSGTAAQILGVVSFVALMSWGRLLMTAWSWDAAYVLPSALVIWGLAANPSTWLAHFLASKPMVLFGGASFAFYLLHRTFMGRLALDVGATNLPAWMLGLIMTFGAVLLLAVGVHLVVEVPSQRWIRRTFDRTSRTPSVELEPTPAPTPISAAPQLRVPTEPNPEQAR